MGHTRLTLGGPASAFVTHALQGGEGHVEVAVGTGPEAPQAVAVEVRVRLRDRKGPLRHPGGATGRAGEGCTHGQAVVGEEIGHPVAAFHLVGLHLRPLEEPREARSGGHRLGTDVEVLFLQAGELAQAIRHLQEDGEGDVVVAGPGGGCGGGAASAPRILLSQPSTPRKAPEGD